MPSLVAAQEPVERKKSRYPGNQNIPRRVKSLGVRPEEDLVNNIIIKIICKKYQIIIKNEDTPMLF